MTLHPCQCPIHLTVGENLGKHREGMLTPHTYQSYSLLTVRPQC